jgi:hypothetical protein
MRRKIKVFTGKEKTSFYFLNFFFSSLPLPPAARGKAHGAWRLAHSANRIIRFAPCALRYAHTPPQKLFIIKTQMNKTTKDKEFLKSFLSVNSVISVAKKNKL